MQEFSSISVSSYEAGTLADRLTEQAGDGWAVVSIVPTGSTVTAYLSRTSTEPADVPESTSFGDTAAASAAVSEVAAQTVDGGDVDGGDVAEAAPEEAPGWAAGAGVVAATAAADSAAVDAPADSPADVVESAGADEVADAGADKGAEESSAAAAAASAAPAGWYADPSSRFELRYWDGGQWTEHVSRAGQQYTDPPVA